MEFYGSEKNEGVIGGTGRKTRNKSSKTIKILETRKRTDLSQRSNISNDKRRARDGTSQAFEAMVPDVTEHR